MTGLRMLSWYVQVLGVALGVGLAVHTGNGVHAGVAAFGFCNLLCMLRLP